MTLDNLGLFDTFVLKKTKQIVFRHCLNFIMKKRFSLAITVAVLLLSTTHAFSAVEEEASGGFGYVLDQVKSIFVDGGVVFMSIVSICLIFGLAISIERIITLNLASINLPKFLGVIRDKLKNEGASATREFCETQPGPVPTIVSSALIRYDRGVEEMEKSIIGYGQVEMGKLEKGLSWIALFIALAPMFGFMGTVLGMIEAFKEIQISGEIVLSEIGEKIKLALITTVAGLVVAVILQIFYNYCTSKLESIVNQMEESALVFVDMLVIEDIKR